MDQYYFIKNPGNVIMTKFLLHWHLFTPNADKSRKQCTLMHPVPLNKTIGSRPRNSVASVVGTVERSKGNHWTKLQMKITKCNTGIGDKYGLDRVRLDGWFEFGICCGLYKHINIERYNYFLTQYLLRWLNDPQRFRLPKREYCELHSRRSAWKLTHWKDTLESILPPGSTSLKNGT